MVDSVSESQIVVVWQRQLLDRSRLIVEDGREISIIYPGRPNDERGADFRDAVISTDEEILKGDIEVHVKSSGWQEHGHHRDPAYNRVILHVVLWHNTCKPTRLQNGNEIPVLALERYIELPFSRWSVLTASQQSITTPCSGISRYLEKDALVTFLNGSGEKRFLAKAAGFRRDFARIRAEQSLYQGIMGALGYSRNKLPFLELARRLPLQALESMAGDRISDEEYLISRQTLLLGTAGLLPAWGNGRITKKSTVNKRGSESVRLQTFSCPEKRMSPDDWHLFKVRPSNSPIRRLVAMSHLLLRYREKGLLEGLVGLVGEEPDSRGCRGLESGLRVNALGSGRAGDIVVNILLPFTFAWSRHTSRSELGKKALRLFRRYPRLAENSVERHMSEQLGLNRDLVSSAISQQGLVHIYNNLCTQGRCEECALGKFKARNHV